jgi:Fic family protein
MLDGIVTAGRSSHMAEEENVTKTRSGRFIPHPDGYRNFVPWGLPPNPPIEPDPELWLILSQAAAALGKLDGAAETIPNPEAYAALYIRWEAVLSSQIEGTEVSLLELLEHEAGVRKAEPNWEMKHILGCVAATRYGLNKLMQSPVTMNLIMGCHAKLFSTGFRGNAALAGEIRDTQNYVGAPGSTVQTARFVPPPHNKVKPLLDNLQEFYQDESQLPILIKVALIHSQFETIHPFEDGNGPIGRLLIILSLVEAGSLSRPTS